MPTVDQFRSIFRFKWQGRSAKETATRTGVSTRTVETAFLLERELEGGLDVTIENSNTGWARRTLGSGIEAFAIERKVFSDRRPALKKLAKSLAQRCVVLLPREMFLDGSGWSSGGLVSVDGLSPKYVFEDLPSWDHLLETLGDEGSEAMELHQQEVDALRRAAMTLSRQLRDRLPKDLADGTIVESPAVAVEAVLHSFLSWVARSPQSTSYEKYLQGLKSERDSKGVTVAHGAWRFDMRLEGNGSVLDANRLITELKYPIQSIMSSPALAQFRAAYGSAKGTATELNQLLLRVDM
ncbi:MAG: hypothetical protein HOF01_04890 [Chloroflexi bacterium]|nr:hypothetical protein [Chloroflexota bacterium]